MREIPRAQVTVALSTMNRSASLERCVTAILGGDTLPLELVIVDQSSDAVTERLVRNAGWHRTVLVRYVRQAARGLAASRNAAIAHASQPIVAFTDDDCVPHVRWLTGTLAAFEGPHVPDGVTGPILPLGVDRPGLHATSARTSRVRGVYRHCALPWAVGSGGNMAVKRAWLERAGGFDERLGAGAPGRSAEDMDLLYLLVRAGATLQYEPDAIVFHERKDAAGFLATRESYGFGMGAFCALWLRRHDAYASWILARWCADRGVSLLKACARRRWRRAGAELRMLRGAASGVAYGLASPARMATRTATLGACV